jgi:hypothetical protein
MVARDGKAPAAAVSQRPRTAAVQIDATVIRAVLLPAAMKLLGDWNWYLPNWLNWLPRLAHGSAEPAPSNTPLVLPHAVPQPSLVKLVARAALDHSGVARRAA